MILWLFLNLVCCKPQYSVLNDVLTISGDGTVTYEDIQNTGKSKTIIEAIINEGITELAIYAFSGCSELKKVTIPSSLTTIRDFPFQRCKSLTNIIVSTNNNKFVNDDQGALYNYDKSKLIRAPCSQSFIIPSTVTILATDSFGTGRAFNMGTYQFPNTIQQLEKNALTESLFDEVSFEESSLLQKFSQYSCSYLKATKFIIHKTCSYIDSYAFYESLIANIIFEEESSLISIGSYAFLRLKDLETITLPDSLTNISSGAFSNTNIHCGGLEMNIKSDSSLIQQAKDAGINEKALYYPCINNFDALLAKPTCFTEKNHLNYFAAIFIAFQTF